MGKIAILSSGAGLGIYVPALILHEELVHNTMCAEVFILETFYTYEKQQNLIKNKAVYHKDFRIALTAQKMANIHLNRFDHKKIRDLFNYWDEQKVYNFIIFSGFWVDIVRQYIEYVKGELSDYTSMLMHMDASVSTSWDKVSTKGLQCTDIWMYSLATKSINYSFDLPKYTNSLDYEKRTSRLLIHGGGWGLGTYKDHIPVLNELGYSLDVIIYYPDELKNSNPKNRYFMLDPQWYPWEKENNSYIYPRMLLYDGVHQKQYGTSKTHSLADIAQNCKAIISKPGGGTLLDAICTSTPLILLEHYGSYEKDNALLCNHLNIGITFEDFHKNKCAVEYLEPLYENLYQIKSTIKSFGEKYATIFRR